jgi:glycosyltransferase involved in cell wall biosynthesis
VGKQADPCGSAVTGEVRPSTYRVWAARGYPPIRPRKENRNTAPVKSSLKTQLDLATPGGATSVVFWNNQPTPYVVDRFNAVAESGQLDFTAWFTTKRESDRSWDVDESTWRFPYRYLPRFRVGRHGVTVPAPLMGGSPPDVIVSLYENLSYLMGFGVGRLRGVRVVFFAEKTFDAWVTRRKWKEALKRIIFSRVDAVFTTGPDGRRFCTQYGTPADRIFCLTHFNQFHLFAQDRELLKDDRERLRRQLDLRGTAFLCVGRLWKGKGISYLLDAYKDLQNSTNQEMSLLFVGDGEDEASIRERCRTENIRNVVFAGFRQRTELPQFHSAVDIFIFPTLGDPYGLALDEAMASGLPVVSTSAAGEIHERIDDGINGYIVPPADSAALRERMRTLLLHPALRKRLGAAAVTKVAGKTPDRWARDFEAAIRGVITLPRMR